MGRDELLNHIESLEKENQQLSRLVTKQQADVDALTKLTRRIADNAPDMIWAKDLDNRYLFANRALCDRLLMCENPETAVGKNDDYYAALEREKGRQNTFGEVCAHSDEIVKKKRKAMRFVEDGLVRGQYLVLDVHKAPLLDESGNIIGTVGCGRDITRERETQKALEESRASQQQLLETRTGNLAEMNTALKVLLKKRDEDRKALEEKVLYNVKSLIRPYLKKMKRSGLEAKQSAYLEILESNLNEIVAPLSRALSYDYLGFTPTEIKVATMVKQGKKAREIARLLGISTRTVEGYRYAIRDRLGIKGKKVNLRTYLLSIR
jgi:DNA-binding CsgD family transcriptional regulator/PAS domain-containing protein